MLYDAKSPEELISNLDDDWRLEKLQQLREIIKIQAPELEERIHYKMLGYAHGNEYLFHLNAQRNYVSLYVGNISNIDPSGELLQGLNLGKGCIRFLKTASVEKSQVEEFILRAVKHWKAGGDVDC